MLHKSIPSVAILLFQLRLIQCFTQHSQFLTTLSSYNNRKQHNLAALSNQYFENDLVAIINPKSPPNNEEDEKENKPILCVVRPDGGVHTLCQHEDENETDLYIDPRTSNESWSDDVNDDDVVETYGEGWYGQRVVPSLGGGPGYGATADDIWSVDIEVLEKARDDGVIIAVLDLGIAHGEKARGGAI
mmetsp:Transcript_27886/g.32527  ORF Transcript_27886/g.32527 Transcript_27886/m.32527 type:complete len:188 (-) Transcript_27886:4-567(-)